METFPTLSIEASDLTETLAYNPALQSQTENGKIISRAKFTKTKKKWGMQYNYLTEHDKSLLEALQTAVMVAAATFSWTNLKDAKTFTVRFSDAIQFQVEPRSPDLWQAKFTLIED